MKILFFANMYPNDADKVQGMFIKNQLESLVKSGMSVDYLHIKINKSLIDYPKGYFILRKKLKEGNYDLIHAHYGFLGFLAAFQKITPFVLTLHGSDVNIFWQRLFSKIACIFAKAVIVTNKKHKKIMGRKAVLIPTGIDSNTFFPIDKNIARAKLGLVKDSKYVVFPSWRQRRVKNYPLFKKIISELKTLDPRFEEILLEGLTQKEVNLFFNAADILLLTSFSEGSPLVIREALASKLPIVSLDVGDVAERIKNYSNCYIVNNSPNEIISKIMNIIESKKRAESFKNDTQITLESNVSEIKKLYFSVVKNIN